MSTTAAGSKLPDSDTKDDAAKLYMEQIIRATMEQMRPPAPPINWVNAIGIAVGLATLGTIIVAVWGQSATYYAEFSNLKQENTRINLRVDKMETSVNRIPVIETQMGAMKDTTTRIEGDIKDVKRLLEARK